MAKNNYSNVITPSDGVRRFLCGTSVLLLGLAAVLYSYFAYRMNAFEREVLGSSARSIMLYAAYVMVPLGILTAGAFSRIKAMGPAFGMISLIVSVLGIFIMFMNSIASLKYERNFQGILGSALEFLTFAAALTVLINLTMSCMEFKTVPVLGIVGAVCAAFALIITGIRIITYFSSMQFAWNQDFDWNNLAEQIKTDNLQYQAKWIFRNIRMSHPDELKKMFMLRFYERISSCVFYGAFAVFFINYRKEMASFNKLMDHASEYVDIPTMRISDSIAKTEQIISDKIKNGGNSVKKHLRKLNDMTRAKGEGLDITNMSDEFERERDLENEYYKRPIQSEDGYEDERPRQRRRSEDGYEDERPRQRRRSEDGYEDERPRQRRRSEDGYEDERPRQRRRSEDDYEDERPRQRRRSEEDGYEDERPRQRRRSEDDYEDERPRQRRRSEDGYEDERPRQRRRSEHDYEDERTRQRRRPEDGYEDERPRQRRRPEDNYEDERPRQRRRSEDDYEDERPRQRRRPEDDYEDDELTEEERYIMEERRKRNPNYNGQRLPGRSSRGIEDDYRRRRQERLRRGDSDMQKSMNEYYDNYMQVREERSRRHNSDN